MHTQARTLTHTHTGTLLDAEVAPLFRPRFTQLRIKCHSFSDEARCCRIKRWLVNSFLKF